MCCVRCELCPKTFKTQRGLRGHVTRSHGPKRVPERTISLRYLLHNQEKLVHIFDFLDNRSVANFLCVTDVFASMGENFWARFVDRRCQLSREIPGTLTLKSYYKFIKANQDRCFHCEKKTSCVNFFFKIPVCKACQCSWYYYRCVTKTRARKQYGVSEEALMKLEHMLVRNPHFSTAAPMVLFLESDVWSIAS